MRAIEDGCWCCTLTITRSAAHMKQLRLYYPKLWRALMDKGLAEEIIRVKTGYKGDLYKGFFDKDKESYWLETRPCFFDKI